MRMPLDTALINTKSHFQTYFRDLISTVEDVYDMVCTEHKSNYAHICFDVNTVRNFCLVASGKPSALKMHVITFTVQY